MTNFIINTLSTSRKMQKTIYNKLIVKTYTLRLYNRPTVTKLQNPQLYSHIPNGTTNRIQFMHSSEVIHSFNVNNEILVENFIAKIQQ